MRNLIVSEFVTLDGVMEAPGGEPSHPHSGWVGDFMCPEQEQYKLREVLDADALLIGRVTYESFAGAWPNYEGPFADKMNEMPKFVVSRTLRDPEWSNTVVIQGDVVAAVTALKETDGGPILVAGSLTLVRTLLEAWLVDQLRLMTFPVTIGGGLRAFPDTRRRSSFTLLDMTTFPTGVTVQTYELERPGRQTQT